jgi:hypothetical protein
MLNVSDQGIETTQAAHAILINEKLQWQDTLETLERRLRTADSVIQQQQSRMV